MSKNRVLSIDQIAVMGDDELRRAISRAKENIRRAEDEKDQNEAYWLQVDICYFLREREVRSLRADAHRRYVQLMMNSEGFTTAEA
jgi:hypothetical protein